MRHLGLDRAHIVGLSMGGYATLVFGLRYPRMASALVVAGCGSGSEPSYRETYLRGVMARAERFHADGAAALVDEASNDATRSQLRHKDPRDMTISCDAWASIRGLDRRGACAISRASVLRSMNSRRI